MGSAPTQEISKLDGYPLSKMGRTKAALKIALYASTFGGIFSALVLLFLGPQVAKISAQLGTAEYFMVCLFGMTIIAGVSGSHHSHLRSKCPTGTSCRESHAWYK